MAFFKKQDRSFSLKWMYLAFLLPCLALSAPRLKGQTHIASAKLQPVFEGNYLSFYTSGRLLRQHRHPKSGVWNTPARKVLEMWVKRTGDAALIRLSPQTFRRQLVELLAGFPEIHGAIRHRSFTYKELSQEAPQLDRHMSKVISIRKEREGGRAKR